MHTRPRKKSSYKKSRRFVWVIIGLLVFVMTAIFLYFAIKLILIPNVPDNPTPTEESATPALEVLTPVHTTTIQATSISTLTTSTSTPMPTEISQNLTPTNTVAATPLATPIPTLILPLILSPTPPPSLHSTPTPKPDLAIASFVIESSNLYTIFFKYTIVNQGQVPVRLSDSQKSQYVAIHVFLADANGNALGKGQVLHLPTLSNLAPGQSVTGSYPGSFEYDQRHPDGSNGVYLAMEVDSENIVDESDEGNNRAITASLMTPVPTQTNTPVPSTDTPTWTSTPIPTNTTVLPTSTSIPTKMATPTPTNISISTNTSVPPANTSTPTWKATLTSVATVLATNTPTIMVPTSTRTSSSGIIDFGLIITTESPQYVGETVIFTATVNPDAQRLTFLWDFGDGSPIVPDNGDKPVRRGVYIMTHIYTRNGLFNATVSTSNRLGNSQKASTSVNIALPLTPTSTPTDSPLQQPIVQCPTQIIANNPFTCYATDTQKLPVTFTWDWGDGSLPDDGARASHTYTDTGTFNISIRSRNSLGPSQPKVVSIQVLEEAPRSIEISIDGQTYVDSPVTFTANVVGGTHDHYRWVFGDGAHIDDGPTLVTHQYSTAGIYTVSVTVYNSVAIGTSVTSVRILPRPPFNLELFINTQDNSKFAFLATVESDMQVNFLWDFGDGATLTTNQNQIQHTYNHSGKYAVFVKATNSSGSISRGGIAYVGVVNAPSPQIEINVMPPQVIINQPVEFSVKTFLPDYEYKWDLGDSSPIQTGAVVTHTYTQVGAYAANITGLDLFGREAGNVSTDFVVIVNDKPN